MVDPRIVLTGFKEWASVIRGLEEGNQICVLRKGSKHEKIFDLSRRRFWMVPTYEHQVEEYLQPLYRDYLEETEKHREEAGEEYVRIQCWAQARSVVKIVRNERLNHLTDYTVYSPRCLQNRYQLGPNQALHVLLVRAFKLPEPRLLEAQPEYRECSAQGGDRWVELQQRIPLQTNNPALSEDEFDEQVNAFKDRFIREGEDQPEPMLF